MAHGNPKLRDDPPFKRVLIIAYYWPPAGGPGVQRWLKFTKYLPSEGWQPTVLVPEGAAYPVLDPSLVEEVQQDLDILRVPIFEPYEAALSLVQKKGAERLGSGNRKSGPLDRLVRWARGNILLPDPRILWRRPATKAAIRCLREAQQKGNGFDAVVTTGPPHSVHLIGLDIQRQIGLPWVADFRDPWREMDYLEDFLPTQRTRRRHLKMESEVVKNCDIALITSKGIRTSFSVHTGTSEKLVLIPNGWDETDLITSQTEGEDTISQGETQWNLGHFGSVFPIRNAPGLWKAIARWNAEDRVPIHLHFFGVVNPEVVADLEGHLQGQWTNHGYVSHKAAVAAMAQMNALLILQNRSKSGRHAIPGKAFEYLALGKPMAVVTPTPSDLTELVKEWGFPTIGYDNEEAAFKLLGNLMSHSGAPHEIKMAYTRKALTQRLAHCLHRLVEERR